MGSVRRRMKKSTGRARRVGGRQGDEMYEPVASPLYCERHIFVVLAKKAAKAGVGERENDDSGKKEIPV